MSAIYIVNRVSFLAFLAPDLQYPIGGNLLLAVSLTLTIASFAWIFYRPMIGAGLLLAAVSPTIWFAQTLTLIQ